MAYTYDRTLKDVGIDDAETRIREALADKGFGVLTEIDVKATMKMKLDVDMAPYRILGACNPKMAHEAIGIESRVGAMLPCNVILREIGGNTEIGAIDPVASMQAIDNDRLKEIAGKVRDLMRAAVDGANAIVVRRLVGRRVGRAGCECLPRGIADNVEQRRRDQ